MAHQAHAVEIQPAHQGVEALAAVAVNFSKRIEVGEDQLRAGQRTGVSGTGAAIVIVDVVGVDRDHGIAVAGQALHQIVVAPVAVGGRDHPRQVRAVVISDRERQLAHRGFAGLVATVLKQQDRKRAGGVGGIGDVAVDVGFIAVAGLLVGHRDTAEIVVG